MALEQDVQDIKRQVEKINREKPGFRAIGILGATVCFLGMISEYARTKHIEDTINNSHQVQTANVIEGSAPEKFYNIDGQRVYLEIDGKPVAEYLKGRQ